jgi:hypothetical protein
MLRKLYYKIFKRYRRLEFELVPYAEAAFRIHESVGKTESEQWVIAPEEDNNYRPLMVYVERKERITS